MPNETIAAIAAVVSALIAVLATVVTFRQTRRHHAESLNLSQYIAITQPYSTVQEHERLLTSLETPSWAEWRTFIADGFRGSPFLCSYFEQNAPWYEDGLMEIYRPVARERQEVLLRQRRALPQSGA